MRIGSAGENPPVSRHPEITDDMLLLAENAGVSVELLDLVMDQVKRLDESTEWSGWQKHPGVLSGALRLLIKYVDDNQIEEFRNFIALHKKNILGRAFWFGKKNGAMDGADMAPELSDEDKAILNSFVDDI